MNQAILTVAWLLLQVVQAPPATFGFDSLTARVAPDAMPPASSVQELTVNWNVDVAPAGALLSTNAAPVPINGFQVVGRRVMVGAMPRERHPELSADQLVVVGAGLDGSPVSWSLIKDPRIVRAEQPGADGVLTGRTLYRASAQLAVVLPNLPQVAQVGTATAGASI
jgi:hypothetical protein